MHLSYLGPSILWFHILSFLRAHRREWLQSDGCWMAGIPSFPSSRRAHQITFVVAAFADDCDILCLMRWQEIFHFSVLKGSLAFTWFSPSRDISWKPAIMLQRGLLPRLLVTFVATTKAEMRCPCQLLPKLQICEQNKCYCFFKLNCGVFFK